MRVKESKKAGLKISIRKKKKAKIKSFGPITSWQIEEEKLEVVTNFIFLGSTITTDSVYSHEIKTFAP